MKVFLVFTLVWFAAQVIMNIYRFCILRDKIDWLPFILVDIIGTYVFLWCIAGISYLIYLIVELF